MRGGKLLAGMLIVMAVWAPVAEGRTIVTAEVRGPVGPRVPTSFPGYSVEWTFLFHHLGSADPAIGTNPMFIDLMKNLGAYGNGMPTVRLGGGATDASWWNPLRKPNPPGMSWNFNPGTVDALRQFHEQTGAPYILGLNFAHGKPAYAVEEARNFMAGLPRRAIRTFEIGNEPDIYDERPFYRDSRGRERMTRPRSWSHRKYLRELAPFVKALRRVRPRPPLSAPSACCRPEWDKGLPSLLKRHHRSLNLVGFHWYPLDGCKNKKHPGDPGYPAVRRKFLRLILSQEAVKHVHRYGALAGAAGYYDLPFRMTETGSAACGGLGGVGDSFAASLWTADWMFGLWFFGVQGTDFHSAGGYHAPFQFSYTPGGWVGQVQAGYYGQLLFAAGTANRARWLYGATLTTRTARGVNARVYATRDRRGTRRVIVLNKDTRAAGTARIRVRGARRPATLLLLRAPSVGSTTGITFGGQTFSDPTSGKLQGTRVTTTVRPRRGVYSFELPNAAAALLTVPR